jgi:hypothetical protein
MSVMRNCISPGPNYAISIGGNPGFINIVNQLWRLFLLKGLPSNVVNILICSLDNLLPFLHEIIIKLLRF